jgi:enoyl-CoA hydratase
MAPPDLAEVKVAVADGVATVTLNRPEQRNALSDRMMADLEAALDWSRRAPAIRVVVLTGAGERAFCAGADLASFGADRTELERHRARHGFVDLFLALERLGKPVLGRINGHALAGGFGLACSCDLLVAVEGAEFGTPEINVGMWPMMVSAILGRSLPDKIVLEMMMLGDRWPAETLQRYGLVNRVVARADLDDTTAELAAAMAAKSPSIMRLGKESYYQQKGMRLHDAFEYLLSQVPLVAMTEDSKEGIRAFFEKRAPTYTGR